jgi:hypothetical protein
MALQPRIIACGNKVATFAMAVRFLTGPAVMAAASFAVGLRGTLLHVAIVQVLWVGKRGGGDGYTHGGESLLLPPARGQQPGILAVLFLFPVPSRARLFLSLSPPRRPAQKLRLFFLTVLCLLFVFLLCKMAERAGSSAPGHCPLRLRKGVQRAP